MHRWWQFCLSARQCTGASCIQHSSTAALQNSQLPFSWAMAPQQSRAELHRLRDLGSHTHEHELQVTRLNKLSQRLVEAWQCSNTAFEEKMRFFEFQSLARQWEAIVKWGGKIKHLLISYFLSNSSVKNYKMTSCTSKLWQDKLVTFFETTLLITDTTVLYCSCPPVKLLYLP